MPRTPSLASENEALRAQNAELQGQLACLQQQLDWLKRQVFGRKSERVESDVPPGQGVLPFEGLAPVAEAQEPEQETVVRKRRKHRSDNCLTDSGLRFTSDVPQRQITILPESVRNLPADAYEIIDYRTHYRLAQQPASYEVIAYRHASVKLLDSQEMITTAPCPAVLDRCCAEVSLLAGMIVDKFAYHLPLYRQHQRIQAAGITVSRASLTNWVRCALALLAPIVDAQKANILRSKVLAMDETPIKAGRDKKGSMKQGWFWPMYGEDGEIVFCYAPDRGHASAQKLLGHYAGTLLSDGHSAYEHFCADNPAATHAQCWAHTRRYFERALDDEPEAASAALDIIRDIFAQETEIRERDLTPEKILAWRQKHSEPLVRDFFAFCHEQRQRMDLAPKSPFAKALGYASHPQRIDALKVFLGDSAVATDTNHLERALRPIPMGRKNWLFCWNELGAEHVGIAQSLVSTCRIQGIDPYTYLVDVLQRIDQHPARLVEELTPRLWKQHFADNPLRSDLADAVLITE